MEYDAHFKPNDQFYKATGVEADCCGFHFTVTTNDQRVFSFYPDHQPCEGFEGALSRYREIVPSIKLAGWTLE